MQITEEDLAAIRDRTSLFYFLKTKLSWPVDSEDTFTYAGPQLVGDIADRAEVSRILPFSSGDPFAIFLVEFATQFRRGDLREILRKIREQIRTQSKYDGRNFTELIFICATERYAGVRFAHFEQAENRTPHLKVFGWEQERVQFTKTLRDVNLNCLLMPERSLLGEYNWPQTKGKWLSAWNVQIVTDEFFRDFCKEFRLLEEYLREHARGSKWAHDYALQLLSRILFIYFIQRKRSSDNAYWLGNEPNFLSTFWSAYLTSGQEPDSFHSRWLSVLFFQAFNNQFVAGRADHRARFSSEIRAALASVPFLNGGLFTENALDLQYDVPLPDRLLQSVFEFFDSYNFTIQETSPLDVEVAVDPEMIGRVYESLVNVEYESETEGTQGEAGIFYTQRIEIDLMCRLALIDHLTTHLGYQYKVLMQRMVFALETEAKAVADQDVMEANLWEPINSALRSITVCDPACGSGSFLIGMLLVLDDLQCRANAVIGDNEIAYHRRRRIIGQSLYGVDVMEWAVRVAELRLWLQLAVEADLKPGHLRLSPLLPNLSFKVRHGDSLVQDVGGIDFGLHHQRADVPTQLKGQLTRLKGRKKQFYNGDDHAITEEMLRHEEQRLFLDVLENRRNLLECEISRLTRDIDAISLHGILDGMASVTSNKPPEVSRLIKQREEVVGLLAHVNRAQVALGPDTPLPFIWDMAFVEIFEGDKRGFDIIIGNPPYVRSGKIKDMLGRFDQKAYKAKLQSAIGAAYPDFFGYKFGTGKQSRKLNGNNDLCVYFYFYGLSLLNDKGTFCFITSNSWLDVIYGADIQEFLTTHGEIKLIIDNKAKRSFDRAEVNTVIALLGAPAKRTLSDANQMSRAVNFVMFNIPFEDSLASMLWEEVDSNVYRLRSPTFTSFVKTQRSLYEEGTAQFGDEMAKAKYCNGIWGGKYLRAPDIYWKIVDGMRKDLVRLGSAGVADVRFGVKSGVNAFFHLTHERAAELGIEARYLRPLVKTPRKYYAIRIEEAEALVFWCHDSREELAGTAALEYIKSGESLGLHMTPSCLSRRSWYSLSGPHEPGLLWPSAFFERHMVHECPNGAIADKVFYTITGPITDITKAFLNSTVTALFVEVAGYQLNHGGIFVTTDWLSKLAVPTGDADLYRNLYTAIATRDIMLCEDEFRQPDRKKLDEAALASIGIDTSLVGELQDAVREMVHARIQKARRGVTQAGRLDLDDDEDLT